MRVIRIFCLLLLLLCQKSFSTSIDGTVTPSFLEAQYTGFVSGDNARGFVHFTKGFRLPANGTVSLRLAGNPVGGEIDLNNGTLILDDDLFLNEGVDITGTGTIIGNGKAIHLLGNVRLFSGEVRLTVSDIKNTLTFEGYGNMLKIKHSSLVTGSYGGVIGHRQLVGVYFRNMILEGLDSNRPPNTIGDQTAGSFITTTLTTVTFDNVVVGFDFLDFSAALTIINNVTFRALGRLTFDNLRLGGNVFGKLVLIDEFSTLFLPPNILVNLATNQTMNFKGFTSRLFLDNTFLSIAQSGLAPLPALLKGRMIVRGVSDFKYAFPGMARDLPLGDGLIPSNDFTIQVLPSSKLVIQDSGVLAIKNIS